MSKKRERSELEALRGQNRKLQSIIKSLKKQAGRSDKMLERYEEIEDLGTSFEPSEHKTMCSECGKGSLRLVDLKVRQLLICNNCSYRKTIR